MVHPFFALYVRAFLQNFAGDKMNLDDFLNANRRKIAGFFSPIKRLICNDGFSVSIQCGYMFHGTPRSELDDTREYSAFELGFPSHADELISEYAEDAESPTDTVYPYVPRTVVEQLINKHGGIKNELEINYENWKSDYLNLLELKIRLHPYSNKYNDTFITELCHELLERGGFDEDYGHWECVTVQHAVTESFQLWLDDYFTDDEE